LKNYELVIIIEAKEEIIERTKEKIKEDIKALGGTILKEDTMGVRVLAYEIKKKSKGFYYVVTIEIDPQKIVELEKEFKLNESILKNQVHVLSGK